MLSMSYSTQDGALLTRFSLQPLYDAVAQRACPIARTALQKILLDGCGRDNVTLGSVARASSPAAMACE